MTFTDDQPPHRSWTTRSPPRNAQPAPTPRPPLATIPGQPAAQLPRLARSPGHPHPQPDSLHRHLYLNPDAHRSHPRSAPRLRPHRRPHPTDRRVVRQHHTKNHEPPAQPGTKSRRPTARNFGLVVGLPRLGHPLVQPRANILRGVRIATTLIARDQHPSRHHAGDTGQPNPLPYAAHSKSLPKLRW